MEGGNYLFVQDEGVCCLRLWDESLKKVVVCILIDNKG